VLVNKKRKEILINCKEIKSKSQKLIFLTVTFTTYKAVRADYNQSIKKNERAARPGKA
jgi:hypothetical protein